jgi:hypothetical protein
MRVAEQEQDSGVEVQDEQDYIVASGNGDGAGSGSESESAERYGAAVMVLPRRHVRRLTRTQTVTAPCCNAILLLFAGCRCDIPGVFF